MIKLSEFYSGKRVLVTGHNGFKGTWLTKWLLMLGANVIGVSKSRSDAITLYNDLKIEEQISAEYFNISDFKRLEAYINFTKPELIFHLAAQAIVSEGYLNPYNNFISNFNGSLNLIELLRKSDFIKCLLVITSDKVYKNDNNSKSFNENSELGGDDPYSASKAIVEILTNSYSLSYFNNSKKAIGTARAGNVIGIGDEAKDRLIPDILRSVKNKLPLEIRNPQSIRPWQNVIDVSYGYLIYCQYLCFNYEISLRSMNFGPRYSDITVSDIIDIFNREIDLNVVFGKESDFKEKMSIILDSSKAKSLLNWDTKFTTKESISQILEFQRLRQNSSNFVNQYITGLLINFMDEYE